jgi:hypothetical protein
MHRRRHVVTGFMVFSLVVSAIISSCGPGQLLGPTLTPTPTNTLTLLPSPTFTPTPLPTATPTPVTFTNDLSYSWEVSSIILPQGETNTIAVTFTPVGSEIVEKLIFPFGAKAAEHQVNPASVYLTDSEGNKYYVEKGTPPFGGTQMQMDFTTNAITLNFPDIPTGATGFQLNIPKYPTIDLVPASE